MKSLIFSGLVCFLAFQSVNSAAVSKLPPSFPLCSRKDPKRDMCIINAAETAIRQLKKGYQPLGIYSIDPLVITAIDIDQGDGPVSINLKFRDLNIEGIEKVKLSNPRIDLENYKISAKGKLPKLILTGKYQAEGKVLILPIRGDGDCRLVLDDVHLDITLVGKELIKNGVKFMKIENFDFKLDVKKLSMKFENLFNGDKALGENMNRFLNENWQEIFKELKPAIQETFGIAFADISNRIFTKVPFDDIFMQ